MQYTLPTSGRSRGFRIDRKKAWPHFVGPVRKSPLSSKGEKPGASQGSRGTRMYSFLGACGRGEWNRAVTDLRLSSGSESRKASAGFTELERLYRSIAFGLSSPEVCFSEGPGVCGHGDRGISEYSVRQAEPICSAGSASAKHLSESASIRS